MKIYIDESGTFSIDIKQQQHSISCVVALVVPDQKEKILFDFFNKWKLQATIQEKIDKNNEIKGSKLNENDFHSLLFGLSFFDLLVEVEFIDLGLTSKEEIETHKLAMAKSHAKSNIGMKINKKFCRDIIASLSTPNYVQSLATSKLIYKILSIAPTYYAQRHPSELSSFKWIFDAKNHTKMVNFEETLMNVVMPLVQTNCYIEPISELEEADYSYFNKYLIEPDDVLESFKKDKHVNSTFVNISELMRETTFAQSHNTIGLQIVDLIASCLRRGINDRLQFHGWKYLSSMIVMRKYNSVSLTRFSGVMEEPARTTLANFVNYFQTNGKHMLVPDEFIGVNKLNNGYVKWCHLDEIPLDTRVKKTTHEYY